MIKLPAVPRTEDRAHKAWMEAVTAALAKQGTSSARAASLPSSSTSSAGNNDKDVALLQQQIVALQNALNSLRTTVLQLSDAIGTGTVPMLAAAAVDAFALVAETVAGIVMADTSNTDDYLRIVGITAADGDTGDLVGVATSGNVIVNPDWAWTPGTVLWATDDPGVIGDTPGGEILQHVGIAIDATTVLVMIGDPVVRLDPDEELTFDPDNVVRVLRATPEGDLRECEIRAATIRSGLTGIADVADEDVLDVKLALQWLFTLLPAVKVINDSGVTGASVRDALNNLQTQIDDLDTRVTALETP